MSDTKVEKFNELYTRGLSLLEQGKDEDAMGILYQAACVAPEGWLALAVQLIRDGQGQLAIERLKEVLRISPDAKVRAAALNNIGMVLANRGQNAEALEAFEQAAELFPDIPDTWSNLGLMRKWSGEYPAALRYIDRAIRIDPWHEQANFIRSMTTLLAGDYPTGFELYECRWRSKANGLQKIASPTLEWDGTNGTRLLVYGEQGHGDAILALRYAREIRRRGLWQAWVCQKSMAPVLHSVPEIDEVIEVGELLPDFNCHLPAVSLPRIFKTSIDTIPSPGGYIMLPPDPVLYGPGYHVGIVWRGSKAQGNDLFRSTNLDQWEPVLSVPGVTFHSLQVDNADEALLYPSIVSGPTPKDWGETIRMVAGLDLVISVDTSVVHLCGAMGVPCWCALHCRPYFVFPPKLGDATPWYSSVRLYRQDREFEWNNVMERIANDLRGIVEKNI